MKGFLDKTWAKAAAFVLTLVFGVLTVLGGVGVGILISYDVFLDGGDFLRQTMYEGNCVRSIDTADSFLRGTLANAGVLVSDGTYDYSTVENGDVTEEERAQVISDLPRVFAEEFSRDAADCHLTVTVRGNGEVVGTFENFELTDGDKPLYATQETFTYALNTGNTACRRSAAHRGGALLFLSAGHVAGGAHHADGVPDGAVRGAGTVLLLLPHGLCRPLGGA